MNLGFKTHISILAHCCYFICRSSSGPSFGWLQPLSWSLESLLLRTLAFDPFLAFWQQGSSHVFSAWILQSATLQKRPASVGKKWYFKITVLGWEVSSAPGLVFVSWSFQQTDLKPNFFFNESTYWSCHETACLRSGSQQCCCNYLFYVIIYSRNNTNTTTNRFSLFMWTRWRVMEYISLKLLEEKIWL